MKIQIICVGRLKERYLHDGLKEYAKRLSRLCTFEIIEVNDERIPQSPSLSECNKVIEKEGEQILKKIPKDSYLIALCVEGKNITSEEFASKISEITLSGKSTITFIIGGSLGLSETVKKASDFHLSFSSFTFPHQLMRLILSEQIYRAFKISANEEYHK